MGICSGKSLSHNFSWLQKPFCWGCGNVCGQNICSLPHQCQQQNTNRLECVNTVDNMWWNTSDNAMTNSQQWIDCRIHQERLKKQSYDTWPARLAANRQTTVRSRCLCQISLSRLDNGHFKEYVREAFAEVLGSRLTFVCHFWQWSK